MTNQSRMFKKMPEAWDSICNGFMPQRLHTHTCSHGQNERQALGVAGLLGKESRSSFRCRLHTTLPRKFIVRSFPSSVGVVISDNPGSCAKRWPAFRVLCEALCQKSVATQPPNTHSASLFGPLALSANLAVLRTTDYLSIFSLWDGLSWAVLLEFFWDWLQP